MKATNVLKAIRTKYGLTQNEIATMLEISRQSYNNLENNPQKADLDKIYKIFHILNEPIDDFLSALKQDYMSYEKELDTK